jgi:site-specific DNA-methyltransferase (adenine-specific)
MESKIIHGDCIDELKQLPDQSIDLIITDPPYQITACEWDKSFDLEKFWVEVKRVVKPKTAIIIFSSQPFTTDLINSNRKWFRYCWVWHKNFSTNFLHAKTQPLRIYEEIVVFYKKAGNYFPIKTFGHKPTQSAIGSHKGKLWYGKERRNYKGGDTTRYPNNILKFNAIDPKKRIHPTQKPVELIKYLIKTYSQPEDIVLDCFAGSGSVMKACLETNRQYIMIEKELSYFELMKQSDKTSTSATPTLAKPKEFNMVLEVSSTATPKSSPTEMTSPNPNLCSIKTLNPKTR